MKRWIFPNTPNKTKKWTRFPGNEFWNNSKQHYLVYMRKILRKSLAFWSRRENCNNFNSSNAVVSSHLILAYTVRLAKGSKIGTKWLFIFIFTEEYCVVNEKNIDKKLPNRIRYQIWYKRCQKESLVGGSKSAKRESISAGKFGSPVQIRGGSKSAVVTPVRHWLRSNEDIMWNHA